MRNFQVILAMDSNRGIGKGNNLPWRIKKDMDWFRKITTETTEPGKTNVVIMGRNTWESIPEKYRPLPNRLNIVLSKTKDKIDGAFVSKSLNEALYSLKYPIFKEMIGESISYFNIESVYVIGGAQLYNEALRHPNCKNVFVTEVHGEFDCDTFIDPIINDEYRYMFIDDEMEENGIRFTFCTKAK